MSRRQAAPKPEELIKNLDEKVVSIKEDIESIIEELRNDVTAKGNEIEGGLFPGEADTEEKLFPG